MTFIRQFCAVLSCSIGNFVVGNVLGWPSPVLIKILEEGDPMELDTTEISWMIALLYFGNFISPIPGSYMMDYLGRKRTLLICSCLPLTSWILVYFARSAPLLYVARLLAGMWIGVVATVVPTYVAEISESWIRGGLMIMCMFVGTIGLLCIFVVGPRVDYGTLALSFGLVPVVFFVSFFFMPESPYFYVMKNRRRAAIKALMWLRGRRHKSIKAEMKRMVKEVKQEMAAGRGFRQLFTRENRRALIMVEFLAMLQRMTGTSALIAFSSTTLPHEGVGALDPNDCVAVMASVWSVSILLSALLIDKVGRKPLLIISSLGSGLAMLGAAIWFLLKEENYVNVEGTTWIPFLAFLLYGVTFSIGLGPIPSAIQGEVFASNVKAWASAITTEVFSLTSLVFNRLYFPIKENVGSYLNFFIYSSACFACTLFVIFVVIETKGKTLHEIHEELG